MCTDPAVSSSRPKSKRTQTNAGHEEEQVMGNTEQSIPPLQVGVATVRVWASTYVRAEA